MHMMNFIFLSPFLIQTKNDAGVVVIYILHKVVKYLLPQWAICFIFSPLKRQTAVDSVDEASTFSWVEKPVSGWEY